MTAALTPVGRPALVVLDMQEDFCSPSGAYARGGLDVAPLQPLLPRIAEVMAACKRRRIPVIASQFIILTDLDGRPLASPHTLELRPFLAREGFRLGTPGVAISAALPQPDYLIEKTRYSAFYNTRLDVLIRGLGVDQLVLCGIATNGAVEATARDAMLRDIPVVTLGDCCASFSQRLHEASLANLAAIGPVVSAREWLERLHGGGGDTGG